ncbi:MAG: hypothetical protein ABF968_15720 [Acetobacter sp.]
MLDPVSLLVGAAGGIASVILLTWAMLREKRKSDPFSPDRENGSGR